MNNDKWLIRLYDSEKDNLIMAYYTENPEQQLKTYYFCHEHNISINIPHDYENKDYQYNNKEAGSIYDIEVHFGGKETFCTIDIWLENIY